MGVRENLIGCIFFLAATVGAAASVQAQTSVASAPKAAKHLPVIEVAHFWVSSSEKKALDVYRRAWSESGGQWNDLPTKSNAAELQLIMDRVANGYPPSAMQWFANDTSKELAEMGFLQDIEEVARADRWRDFLPQVVIDKISYKGRIYFAPVNIHANNWLWMNKKIYDKLRLSPPVSWDVFFENADKIKAAGYVPVSMGGGAWEISILFSNILYSQYGLEPYLRLISGTDPQSAMSAKMLKSLGILRRVSHYVAPLRRDKTWADAALAVGQGRAAMQFMGDWVKGELMEAGFSLDKDFQCILAPGTESAYFISVDAFAFPMTNNEVDRKSQFQLARQLMEPKSQMAFNAVKGSIPVRSDIQGKSLDACGKIGLDLVSRKDRSAAVHSMALPAQMTQGWTSVVADFFNDPKMSPEAAQRQLVEVLSQK